MSAFYIEQGMARADAIQWLSAIRYQGEKDISVRTLRRWMSALGLPKGLREFGPEQCAQLARAANMARQGYSYEQIKQSLGDLNDYPKRKSQQQSWSGFRSESDQRQTEPSTDWAEYLNRLRR